MEKKNIDWSNLGFWIVKTDYRFVSDFKDGKWDEGRMTEDDKVVTVNVQVYCNMLRLSLRG